MVSMVHEVLAKTVAEQGDRPALRVKRGGAWRSTTWDAYAFDVRRAARALIALGVRPSEGVSIIGKNSPEWLIADVGAIFAGALPAGIYTTSSPAQVRFVTHHCEARVAFADTPEQVAKFLAEEERLPHLEVVVQMGGTVLARTGRLRVMAWDTFLALAASIEETVLEGRLAAQKPDDPCTLIYTSGTTGEPKAVMITHTNIVWMARSVLPALELGGDEVSLSYLPLSHVAEQVLSVHGPMAMGSLVYFAESLDKLAENLAEVRPTLFMGVPRVWEKIQAKMMAAGAKASPLQKKLVAWARRTGLAGGLADQRGERRPLLYPIAKKLIFDKVRKRLGFDRARLCVTSAAPISRSTLEFFLALGIPILEVYGMSECTGPATFSLPSHYRTGKCGIPIPGSEVKIAEDGEICLRGNHIFKGYLKDDDATKLAIDEDGYLHTGDIGTIDNEGFVQITDRKKDLLITAGGENIAPQVIEGYLRQIPVVSQAVVVGDRRKYLAALLTLDAERIVAEAEAAGSPARDSRSLASCDVFRAYVSRQVDAVNEKLARVQGIKRFAILDADFSIDSGELTPTMKLKRNVINSKYEREIDALYPEG